MWLKRYIPKCTLSLVHTHHDMTDLENHRMVKNTKSWTSRERNITFLWSKKILNLCLRWRIFRSYCFVEEVTFNSQNVLSVIKVFCQFFLKGLLIYKNICWQNPAKTFFLYQQWTATAHIFLKAPTSDSLVFFSEHVSRTAILAQASVITCK